MSTRATYSIESNGLQATFYIHYDGYPQGAAEYFANMGQTPGRSLIDRFYRGNPEAEFTKSHAYHEDTDFRYTLGETGYLRIEDRDGRVVAYYPKWEELVKEYENAG